VLVTGVTVVLAVPMGTAAALALVRRRVPGRAALEALFLSLSWCRGSRPVSVSSSWPRASAAAELRVLVAAHVIVVLPFVVRSVSVSVANLDPMLERAAASLGAPPRRVFRRVTLPLLRPGLAAAVIFAVLVSVNEFVVSLLCPPR
jgi:putative spermidine/putrescine transport system permease protein